MADAPSGYPRHFLVEYFRQRREEGHGRRATRPAREIALAVRERERLQRLDSPGGITRGTSPEAARAALRGSVS